MAKQLKHKPRIVKSKVTEKNYGDQWETFQESNSISMKDIVDKVLAGRAEITAKVLVTDGKSLKRVEMGTKEFIEAIKRPHQVSGAKLTESQSGKVFREAIDAFALDSDDFSTGSLIGQDFVPLLGGPFNKQMYLQGQLQQYSQAFYAFHHDPVARFCVLAFRDFTLGREWRVDAVGKDAALAQMIWDATCKANVMDEIMNQVALELSINGECFLWELPNDQAYITQLRGLRLEEIDKALFPRFRLVDPGLVYDYITDPVDIKKVFAYQLVGPTQYQIFSSVDATGEKQPTAKFWYEQIPASQMGHFKVNATAFEKRGRSDLYPVLSYLKRLRDAVNYQVIALQKASAYSLDTTIDGSQSDIDAYADAQASLGTIPPAGSEFIHSKKVERKYLGAEGGRGGGQNPSFEWCLSMIACGVGIPVSYLGAHISGTNTRASAMVATEPVVKRFETRRNQYQTILTWMFDRVMKKFGLDAECEITFPELVVQDRSAKLKDLALCETQEWFSKKRCAEIAAIELDADEFNFEEERQEIESGKMQLAPMQSPLTAEPEDGKTQPQDDETEALDKRKGITNNEKRGLKLGRGF